MDCLRYSSGNKGVLVITPTKVYDVAHNSDDEEFMEFGLFMSRREYKMIKRRMDRGREHAVVEGNYMGFYRPYGYDILKTKNSRTLLPNKEEAPIVKLIFEWATKEKHNKAIDDMNRQVFDLESSIPEKEEYEEKIIQFSDTLSFLSNQSVDADIKNVYLKSILERIEFGREPSAPNEFILDVYIK